ncbi:type I restriction endonuclease subunit R [Rhodopirellula sallentina]|uniref:Type I restriction enzyme endonuclease subunit n=1 Tax=Rhodopirellula sallentina SM41 TaxID=1263870 RepID=M5U0W8_9BACT|nr:type I restriction endonuclease subunit R [Rhodopirellula sallentina]EMI55090.1 type I site-specific deoxyribonuclease, HsdR family [Rhodopirellula sallentina SM41]
MPALDFKEIAQANKADGDQDQFEFFARDFLKHLGYEIIIEPSRGPDDGRDLVVEETRTGVGGKTQVRWLVSCKHNAHSKNQAAVGVDDEVDIEGRVRQHQCQGFIAFYSTLPSSGLMRKLESLECELQVFDREKIESSLLGDENGGLTLVERYFPLSAAEWRERKLRKRAQDSQQEFCFFLPNQTMNSFDQGEFKQQLADLVGATADQVHVAGLEDGSVRVTIEAPLWLGAVLVRPTQNAALQSMGIKTWTTTATESAFTPMERPTDHRLEDTTDAPIQSEAQLEESLIERLGGLGYTRVAIPDEAALLANLKKQLEKHNDAVFSDEEFAKVLNHLDKGNVFERAKILRDRFNLTRDDGSSFYVEFLNVDRWCQNEYQVANQITMDGSYKNRYDVTLLVNGLPLVQIELKRRGLELKEAFNQINRYQRHSFWANTALFNYVQIFVISNGVNTKYYANNRNQHFKQTFYWAREDNDLITQLDQFADTFLEKCHVSKMICRYIVLQETDKVLMILRPYQYYAVEKMIRQVKTHSGNGYIWHTTGSGKTLTSFKASQILQDLPDVDKVVFVVDRADLDYQTTVEFNAFSKGSVDGTDNTKSLVKQLTDSTSLIVTTIQKLNNAINPKSRHLAKMQAIADKRIIFIFDECHRSQFGETHKRITQFFQNFQMFGFTGTPIFADNASKNELGKRTTKDLFGECLHKYVITNAIKDENVLKFSVEYWGRLRRKDGSLIDEKVASINTKEFFEDEDRIEKIVDWIIENHDRKTHHKAFTAILAVGSVDALITYYEKFREKKEAGEHKLRVVTVFSFTDNEEDADADGLIGEPDFDIRTDDTDPKKRHTRERLDEFIADYNALFGTAYSTRDNTFYSYYKDIGKRIKDRERKKFKQKDRVDILLVVNMFLTGFDAKKVNTLYVDKNLKYHGLIQAYSRTNRILDSLKSQGNVVCFRNLKVNTDKAIGLFSNKQASETILIEPYEDYVKAFNDGVKVLLGIAPTVDSVNDLQSEDDILRFVQAFRDLIRAMNVLKTFSQFTFADLYMKEQTFEDYKSKYLDIFDRTRAEPEQAASIVKDVDFELELIHRDEINVAYILKLLAELHAAQNSDSDEERKKVGDKKRGILDLLGSETQLRSKRVLIEQFINRNMPQLKPDADVEDAFRDYWDSARTAEFEELCKSEGLVPDAILKVLDQYHFTGRMPLRDDIVASMTAKPKILERKKVTERIIGKLLDFIQTFEDSIGEV